MAFTTQQLQTLKFAINGNSTAVADVAAGNYGLVANLLNSPASPQTLIWIPNLPVAMLLTGVVWSEFIALSTAQQLAWQAITQGGTIDATNANIRAGFASIFSAPSSPSLTNLAALAQRPATNLEAVFTTAGVSSVFGQSAVEADVHAARAS